MRWVSSSGTTLMSRPSQAGAPDQQFLLAVRISSELKVQELKMKGPVPIVTEGSMPNWSPAASVVSSSRMEAPGTVSCARKEALGWERVMEKSRSSMVVKPPTSSREEASPFSTWSAPLMPSAMSLLTAFG